MTTSTLPIPSSLPAPRGSSSVVLDTAGDDDMVVVDPGLRRRPQAATVDIVIPVYNEERDLPRSVHRLHAYLRSRSFPLTWTITIADNASTDGTWTEATRLTQELDGVRAVRLARKGRGNALRRVWGSSASPVVAYMDVDLSTDLDALLPLVAPLVSGHSDLAIGTRLARGSRVVRGPKREALSRSYNLILRAALQAGFSDAQCGFKAARADALRELLPMVRDGGWFFDTELLVLAEHNGLRIHEVPVDWTDDTDSRVHVASTVKTDLLGVWRMVRAFARGDGTISRALPVAEHDPMRSTPLALPDQFVRFASIGTVSTILFGILFVALSGPLGFVAADAVALAVCTVANTAAHRRLTFALSGRTGRVRHHVRGLLSGALPLAANLAALGVAAAGGVTGVWAVLGLLTAANAVSSLARLTMVVRWVFRDRTA